MRTIKCIHAPFGDRGAPAPAVQAFFYIPRLNYRAQALFLIDTGASGSCINGFRAYILQSKLLTRTMQPTRSIGGIWPYYHERATLVFRDEEDGEVEKSTLLGIQKLTKHDVTEAPYKMRLPCILGRDILTRCKFSYNYPEDDTTINIL
jgi:hypothetical protein